MLVYKRGFLVSSKCIGDYNPIVPTLAKSRHNPIDSEFKDAAYISEAKPRFAKVINRSSDFTEVWVVERFNLFAYNHALCVIHIGLFHAVCNLHIHKE